MTFSPAGDLLAAGNANGHVYLWSVTGRRLIANLLTTTNGGGVYGVAFGHDGKLLAGMVQSISGKSPAVILGNSSR